MNRFLKQISVRQIFLTAALFIIFNNCLSFAEDYEPSANLINFSKIDQVSQTGQGVKVAVIDWLFDLSDSAAQKYIDPASMVPGEPIGELEPWHGEWMAEIIHTIAPEAKIIPIRASSQKNRDYQDYLIKAIYYAADHGATVVTCSMGPIIRTPAYDSAISYAESKGTVFINCHPEFKRITPDSISICSKDESHPLVIHSGVVSVPDYEVTPESAREIYTWPYDLVAHFKDGWGYSNGPPIVAGVIAMIKEANPKLTTTQIRRIIKTSGYDYHGFNVLDAKSAVAEAIKLGR